MDRTELDVVPGVTTSPGPGASALTYLGFVVRRNGYGGDISYSVSAKSLPPAAQPPDVVVLQFDDPSLDSIGSVRVAYPSSTTPGTYVYELRATAGDLGSVTRDIVIRVSAFVLLSAPSSIAVSRGQTNTVGLTLLGDPATGITISTTTPPAGVTATVSNPGGTRAYVDISAAPTAATGTFTLRITARAGQQIVTHDVALSILPEQPTRSISFRMCRSQNPFYYAKRYLYANEGSAWTTVSPDADFVIRIDATDRIAFAEEFAFPGFYGSGTGTRIMYLTVDELSAMQCAPAALGSHDFVVAATDATRHYAALGAWRAFNGFTQASKQSGTADLIATGTRTVPTGSENRMILRRDQDISDGATISLDFSSTEAVVLDSAVITWNGPSGNPPSVYLQTPSTIGLLGGVTTTSAQYFAVPEAALLPGEVQSLVATRGDGNVGGEIHWFRGAHPLTISFGPDVAAPAFDEATATISLPSQTEYPDLAGVGQRFTRDFRGVYDFVEVWQSRAYLGSTPANWIFRVPDLGREGALRAFEAGEIGAMAATGPASLFFGGTGSPGAIIRWGHRPGNGMGSNLPFPRGY